jgi:hypothetical protein
MRVDRLRGASVDKGKGSDKQLAGFYVFLVVALQQIWGMNVIGQFPSVIALGVSLPFHQVLQGMTAPEALVITNGFNFIFFFTFY